MTETDHVNETIRLAFAAKKNQYRSDPQFRLDSVGPLTWLHGVPGWYEVDAFYARNIPSAQVIETVQACSPHPRHMVSVLVESAALPDGMAEEYTRLGYKRLPEPPQPLMRFVLSKVIASSAPHIDREETDEGLYRYRLLQNGTVVSRAEIVWADPGTIYVFGMQTLPEYRRLGLATALLTYIHQDAESHGAKQSILWSSPLGLLLYTTLGYKVAVTGHGFIPI